MNASRRPSPCLFLFALVLLLPACTPAAQPSLPASPTATHAPTRTAALPTSSPEPAFTLTPTQPPPLVEGSWDFKLAYIPHFLPAEGRANEKTIWLLEPPYTAPRPVFTTEQDFTPSLSWSHDGQRLAFAQRRLQTYLFRILNVETQETLEYSVPYENAVYTGLTSSPAWSADDRRLAFTVYQLDLSRQEEALILDLESGEVQSLGFGTDFVGWSPVEADRFVYLQYNTPPTGENAVAVGRVGESAPLRLIHGMGKLAPEKGFMLVLAPDGQRAISVSYDGANPTQLTWLDLAAGEWQELGSLEGVRYPSLWSPDGRWLVFSGGQDAAFVTFSDAGNTMSVVWTHKFMSPRAWAPDSRTLFYQDEAGIYAVDPDRPDETALVLNLWSLGDVGDLTPTAFLWVRGRP